jgi:uncharacterized protein (DUF1697 family)
MERYAAFLRGINLGDRRVTGKELRVPFQTLGLSDVATFMASGNVVFDVEGPVDEAELGARIEGAVEEELGFASDVFLRSGGELATIVGREPFSPDDTAASAGKLQVMLLRERPEPTTSARVLDHAGPDDRLALQGRELYWLPSGTMSASDLDLTAVQRMLGTNTMRTANTLRRLLGRFFALALLLVAGCSGPGSGCELEAAPTAIVSDSSRLLQYWIVEDRPAFASSAVPDSPALRAFRAEVSGRFDTDARALLRAQLPHVEGGDAANVRAVLDGEAGRIRQIRCLEALLLSVQAERTVSQGRSMFERPTEFAAWILERDGALKIWYFTVDQPGIGSLAPVHGMVSADQEQGWRVRQLLHNHNFFPEEEGVLGGVVPSVSDVGYYRIVMDQYGAPLASITNGFHTLDLEVADLGALREG